MKDLVCGREIGNKGEITIHNGKLYQVCSVGCRWAFEMNPEQFLKKDKKLEK
ncbi:MAG: hypothetical protein K5790_01450 [Nitrosopumilus sp.]|uniref:hypothetical protein n=1 Tax=Nitrosopumilus sp. TaxID=2024843 RepID=UPI00247E65BF|nr:hypothetical protein [Nitrosopumilus sp.]MCV0391939.1 hypothetical protein [Nitrosopumilus sp.]